MTNLVDILSFCQVHNMGLCASPFRSASLFVYLFVFFILAEAIALVFTGFDSTTSSYLSSNR